MKDLRGFFKPELSGTPQPKLESKANKLLKADERRRARRIERRRRKRERLKLRGKAKQDIQLKKAGVKPIGRAHPDYKRDDGFYNSNAWRRLRYAALKLNDGRCECCGAKSADGVQLHVDHIIPRYKNPKLSLEITNLQILCEDCNLGKGAWDSTDWRSHMRSIMEE